MPVPWAPAVNTTASWPAIFAASWLTSSAIRSPITGVAPADSTRDRWSGLRNMPVAASPVSTRRVARRVPTPPAAPTMNTCMVPLLCLVQLLGEGAVAPSLPNGEMSGT